MSKVSEELRGHITAGLGIDRKKALRVCYWLQRLHEHSLAHADVGIVPYQDPDGFIRSLVATVDYREKAVGCAVCGEWAADSGGKLQRGFRAVRLVATYLPHDIRDLNLYPAVLYCEACWKKDRDYYLWSYELSKDEADSDESSVGAEN